MREIYLLSPTPKTEMHNLPMITFSQCADTLDLSTYDTLLFTSKQAVKSAELIDPKWKRIPCIAIGSATKKQIESLGGKVIYMPESFYAQTLSQDILEKFKDKKLLYLRPKEVSFDIKGTLEKEKIVIEEQVIYETSCISYSISKTPLKDAIIIFTSPSTIHCFLKNFIWDKSYIAVVIGEATKVHLPGDTKYVIAQEPTIEACVKRAEALRLESS